MKLPEQQPEQARSDGDVLRFLTCGSVDDGKSTLIGRLLCDTKAILADNLHAIERTSQQRGLAAADLALLTDGLIDEREQGITIDVAYRYFSTGTRKYIVADAPGHEQYTRNMATAASTANLAIILVDARKGVLVQTRRHSIIASLLGIPHLVVAVNKMDLVGYAAAAFERIRAEYLDFARQVGIGDVQFVPMSALHGDMIVARGERLAWYTGPTLLEILETALGEHDGDRDARFRFPVQGVCRPGQAAGPAWHDYRGYMGRIESGAIAVGDAVTVLPGGRTTRVKDIQVGGRSLHAAGAEQSVTLLLEDDIDIARGDMICLAEAEAAPQPADRIRARICWLSETPLDPQRPYLIRHTTRDTRARLAAIGYRLNVATLRKVEATRLAMNDIAQVDFRLARPIFCDRYAENRATGAFIVIDETTNDTVGAGMIV